MAHCDHCSNFISSKFILTRSKFSYKWKYKICVCCVIVISLGVMIWGFTLMYYNHWVLLHCMNKCIYVSVLLFSGPLAYFSFTCDRIKYYTFCKSLFMHINFYFSWVQIKGGIAGFIDLKFVKFYLKKKKLPYFFPKWLYHFTKTKYVRSGYCTSMPTF